LKDLEDLFYQFYDVLVIVLALVFIYTSVKRGISKTLLTITGYFLGIVIASKTCGAVSEKIYSGFIQSRNTEIIYENISDIDFSRQYKAYSECLGYGIIVNSEKLDEIFRNGENITEKTYNYFSSLKKDFDSQKSFSEKFEKGCRDILFDALKPDIPSFIIENPDFPTPVFDESIRMMYNNDMTLRAVYIEENFTRASSLLFIRTVLFIIIMSATVIIAETISDRFSFIPYFGIADNILGVFSGIAKTAVILIIISEILVLLINAGNDEIFLLNSSEIEKTRIFKYIYNTVTGYPL